MKRFIKTLKTTAAVAAVATIAFAPSMAKADASLNTDITATVLNAFNLVETTPMSFGSFAIFTDGATATDITLDLADTGTYDSVNDGTSRSIPITAPTTGVFDISAAAPTAEINIAYTPTVTLVCGVGGGCSGAEPDFTVDTWTDNSVANVVTTDIAGAFTLTTGADLHSDAAVAVGAYEDGTYTGTLTIDATY